MFVATPWAKSRARLAPLLAADHGDQTLGHASNVGIQACEIETGRSNRRSTRATRAPPPSAFVEAIDISAYGRLGCASPAQVTLECQRCIRRERSFLDGETNKRAPDHLDGVRTKNRSV